ncbi:hypothetical protein GX51_04018 [Blastomyces parvus]|uniref:Uncharacterized protein n=1 Tax=Blastomyces parvus TaxID=2060905 RepID=A0A2B7X4C5_9EURO|nr:hypothetical protein GX51_04018 [Blastomyces parvus]
MSTTTFSTKDTPAASDQQPASPSESADPTTVLLTYLTSPSSATTVLEDLHASLLSSLQRCGWTEQVRGLALDLLRGGHCDRFEEVVDTVVALATGGDDVTASFLAAARARKRKRRIQMMKRARLKRAKIEGGDGGVVQEDGEVGDDNADAGADADGADGGDGGDGRGDTEEDYAGNGTLDEFPDIRIPQTAVAEGVKMLHEALEEVFVVEGGGAAESTSSNTTTTGETDSSKDQQQEIPKNKPGPASTTNGIASTNGTITTLPKKPPVSSSASSSLSSLKTTSTTSTTSTKSTTKLKAVAKGKLQENGDGRAAKKTKKG